MGRSRDLAGIPGSPAAFYHFLMDAASDQKVSKNSACRRQIFRLASGDMVDSCLPLKLDVNSFDGFRENGVDGRTDSRQANDGCLHHDRSSTVHTTKDS